MGIDMSDENLTIIQCPDHGWSAPISKERMEARGLPLYCDTCGNQVSRFITYTPEETFEVFRIVGDSPRWELSR